MTHEAHTQRDRKKAMTVTGVKTRRRVGALRRGRCIMAPESVSVKSAPTKVKVPGPALSTMPQVRLAVPTHDFRFSVEAC